MASSRSAWERERARSAVRRIRALTWCFVLVGDTGFEPVTSSVSRALAPAGMGVDVALTCGFVCQGCQEIQRRSVLRPHGVLMRARLSVRPGTVRGMAKLNETDLQILDFERQWWKYAGAKEQAIRERFGLSATAYYARLNALIDEPAAMAADPMLVRRLRRLRSARARARSARRLGFTVEG